MRKWKFAIIGMGNIGKRYWDLLETRTDAEVIAIADPVEKNISADIPQYSSLEDLLQKEQKIDIAIISSPNGFHFEQTITCLDRGISVILEKPVCFTKEQTFILLEHPNSRQVFPVMQNRYSPPSQWLKKVIFSEVLGKIFTVHVNCFWNRDTRYYTGNTWRGSLDLDGGPLYTQFSHFLDLIIWMFGELKVEHTEFHCFNHQKITEFEDTGNIKLVSKDGTQIRFHYSTSVWDKNLESSITIIAEHGSIKVGGQYMNQILHCHIKDYTLPEILPTNPNLNYGDFQGSAGNHALVLDEVISHLNGEKPYSVSLEEAALLIQTIEKIYYSRSLPLG